MRGLILGLYLPPTVQGMDLRSRNGDQTGAEGPESGPSKPGKPAIGTETCINAAVVTIGGQGGSHGRARWDLRWTTLPGETASEGSMDEIWWARWWQSNPALPIRTHLLAPLGTTQAFAV